MTQPPLYGVKHGRFLKPPLDWAACGTSTANYRAHLRRGEKACRPCREAEARRQRDRNDAVRAAGGRPISVTEKMCGRCRQTKAASEFTRDRIRHDGLCFYCKRCWKSHWRKS